MQQIISQVASVDAIVTIDNVRASIEQTVRLVARNTEGGVVDGVSIAPDAAVVNVPMEQLSNYRDLAVRAQLSGQPAEGYAITNIGADPQVVTVFGPKEAILQLPGFIETLEVAVEDATGDIEQRIGLTCRRMCRWCRTISRCWCGCASSHKSARARFRASPL